MPAVAEPVIINVPSCTASVMRCADGEQASRVMTAAVGARVNVVNVNEISVRAARDLAAVMISPQHAPAYSGRHVLCRSLGLIG